MKKTNKIIKILIPNATSPRNMGDYAILEEAFILLNNLHLDKKIRVHSSDPHLYRKKYNQSFRNTLYSYSVFSVRRFFVRVIRLVQLAVAYFVFRKRHITSLFSRELQGILADYRGADIILFAGGGYLRSQKGFKQSLNLIMSCTPFFFAKRVKARTVVLPISFGPFAYQWQEKLSANVLRSLDVVSIREEISFNILKKHRLGNLVLSSDLALLLNTDRNVKRRRNEGDFTIGLTVRNWGSIQQQQELENSIIKMLESASKEIKLRVQPIIQVDAQKYGEQDKEVTKRIVKKLIKLRVNVLPLKVNSSLSEAMKAYASIDLLLGMRMHSNILAAVQGTPFLGIAYEHKTIGIAKQLGVAKYCIQSTVVTEKKLSNLLLNLYENRKKIRKDLLQRIKQIQIVEEKRWDSILNSLQIIT